MFESAVIDKLAADTALCALLSEFEGAPSIFSEFAPETAEMPYLTVRITRNSDNLGSPAVQRFSVFVDYYENGTSYVNARYAAERVEYVLDRISMEHERYSRIRLFFFAGSAIPEEDPRDIHHNLQFEARAGRKKWIDQLNDPTTTTTTTTTSTTTTAP